MITRRGLLGWLPLVFSGSSVLNQEPEETDHSDFGAVFLNERIVVWSQLPRGRGFRIKMRDDEGQVTEKVVSRFDLEGWSEWVLEEGEISV